jgi:RNA methyltransferase, TrmH family
LLSDANARLGAARALTTARGRRAAGRFLAEGPQAVREAVQRLDLLVEVFFTAAAELRHAELIAAAQASGVAVDEISAKAAATLSETVTPQGLVAVCRDLLAPSPSVLTESARLVVALVEANDPGNAGTILRTADAAGADAVVFAGAGVDPYNGKCVRASAGSLFHLSVATEPDPLALIAAAHTGGWQVLATTGSAALELDEVNLAGPTLWLFGNEARGLDDAVLAAADTRVRVPIYGRAESLNLAASAAVCLYASARALYPSARPRSGPPEPETVSPA